MSVHMIRIHSEDPPDYSLTEIQTAIQDWMDNHTEWVEDSVTHEITRRTSDEEVDAPEWLTGQFRFESGDDQTALLDDAERRLQNYTSWYRLGVHICDHDSTGDSDCSWDDQREFNSGQIPAEVPTFL